MRRVMRSVAQRRTNMKVMSQVLLEERVQQVSQCHISWSWSVVGSRVMSRVWSRVTLTPIHVTSARVSSSRNSEVVTCSQMIYHWSDLIG